MACFIKNNYFVVLVAAIMLGNTTVAYADASLLNEPPHCPPIKDPSYIDGNTKTLIGPPVTAEQRRLRREQLYLTENTLRRHAITALAMTGDVELLRDFISKGDQDDLRSYVGYFRSEDKTQCLSAEVEKIITDNLHDPANGVTLLGLLWNNIYQSRSLAQSLLSIASGMPGYERHYISVITALTATNRTDITEQVFDHAKSRIEHYKNKHKILPPTNELSAYLAFFARQQYQPAIRYFYALIETTSTENMSEYVRSGFMDTRLVILKQAEKQPSEWARTFLLKESTRLSSSELIAQVSEFELSALYAALLANNQGGVIDSEIISSIDILLNKTRDRLKDKNYLHSIRYELYETLAKINSAKAYDRLVQELVALKNNPTIYDHDLYLLVNLAAEMAERMDVDIATLLHNNPFPNDLTKNDRVVDMLKKHPYPAGRAYLTDLLGKLDAEPGRDSYFYNIIDALSEYDAPAMLEKTRQEIDSLYQSGKLTVAEYEGLRIPLSPEELEVMRANRPMLDDVKRVFYDLKLPVQDKMLSLKGGVTNRLSGFYELAHKQNYYLIRRQYGDGSDNYLIINRSTGERLYLCGEPIVSPNKEYMACTLIDIELGEVGNVIKLYKITSHGLEEIWQFLYPNEIRTGPWKAHWQGNETLDFEEAYYVNDQFLTRRVELRYLQNQWVKRIKPTN